MGKWIDVNEKLPTEEERYLTFRRTDHVDDGRIEIQWWSQRDVWTKGFYADGEQDTNVTHWMELPEAPLQSQTPTDQTLKNPSAGRGR